MVLENAVEAYMRDGTLMTVQNVKRDNRKADSGYSCSHSISFRDANFQCSRGTCSEISTSKRIRF